MHPFLGHSSLLDIILSQRRCLTIFVGCPALLGGDPYIIALQMPCRCAHQGYLNSYQDNLSSTCMHVRQALELHIWEHRATESLSLCLLRVHDAVQEHPAPSSGGHLILADDVLINHCQIQHFNQSKVRPSRYKPATCSRQGPITQQLCSRTT